MTLVKPITDSSLEQIDEDCVITDLHTEIINGINKDIVNLESAAINIENSSDVIIGSVNNFNGPVTIFQNTDNGPVKNKDELLSDSKQGKSDQSEVENPSRKVQVLQSTYFRYIGIPLFIIVVIIVISLSVTQLRASPVENRPNKNSNDTIGAHLVIYRKIWGGKPSLNFTRPLRHPTPLVIISHSAGPFCTTISECSAIVKSIQEYHVGTIHSPDIGYNFLIGGDGNIYVGRGWDIRNFHRDNTIGVCFIGNFIYDQLTPEMIDASLELFKFGVKIGKLSQDHKVICHNQTMVTLSPGENVYKVVKEWPNFMSGSL